MAISIHAGVTGFLDDIDLNEIGFSENELFFFVDNSCLFREISIDLCDDF